MHESVFPFYLRPRTPFLFDTKIIEIIIICLITAVTFIIILPGIRGKLRIFWIVKVLTSLFIGTVILSVNFTRDWEVGSITVTTVYKSFSHAMVNASIGLWVGLRGLNITLAGDPIHQFNETIDYNERFSWETRIQYDTDYQEGLERGLPNPILYVAEKFISISPCRLHQQYCASSYYASALMWCAFCAWILSNVLFCVPVPLYGIYMMFATAVCIIFSLISFATVRQVPICNIHFGTSILQTRFGFSFWISFATGMLCLFISFTLLTVHIKSPAFLRRLFSGRDNEEVCPKPENEESGVVIDNETVTMITQL
ncbi:dual oxidase maturation factor 1-like [Rana temporaria]|uniref:dual oxidase maturation factor 1-like n=1 Tax=Rana temporaria TaxID=8407 RepID=UPI001AAD1323|nr:dual oxidase maturation factor 1-like [Rana temporaria]XP_040198777.1 dual oxidase maturation factor 1-like [Rana temporaria]